MKKFVNPLILPALILAVILANCSSSSSGSEDPSSSSAEEPSTVLCVIGSNCIEVSQSTCEAAIGIPVPYCPSSSSGDDEPSSSSEESPPIETSSSSLELELGSSSSLTLGNVFCLLDQNCIEVLQNICEAAGTIVEFCPSSSSKGAAPSSSSEESPPIEISSSSLALGTVFCVVGPNCTEISQAFCDEANGEVVPYCPSSSSSSKNSLSSPSSSPSGTQGQVQFYGDSIIDLRDNKKYKYEKRKDRIWMSENLNYSKGGTVGWCYKTAAADKTNLGEPGEDLPGCNSPYGRSYTWEIAMDNNAPQGLCPDGWDVPSYAEWGSILNTTPVAFFTKAGNYNTDDQWTIGWGDRNSSYPSGFLWSSTLSVGNPYFVQVGTSGSSTTIKLNRDDAPVVNYFSMRCIMREGTLADCGGISFDPLEGTCSKCGSTYYPTDLYFCDATNSKIYKQAKIGTKTMMVDNLEHDGKQLFDWAAAMALGPACNLINCADEVKATHQGICPTGWHIPKPTEITQEILDEGIYSTWTTTDSGRQDEAMVNVGSTLGFISKASGQPVRCIKN